MFCYWLELTHAAVCPPGNTVSNLILILPPIYGAIQTLRDGLETRYVFAYVGLAGKNLSLLSLHYCTVYELSQKLLLVPVQYELTLQT